MHITDYMLFQNSFLQNTDLNFFKFVIVVFIELNEKLKILTVGVLRAMKMDGITTILQTFCTDFQG